MRHWAVCREVSSKVTQNGLVACFCLIQAKLDRFWIETKCETFVTQVNDNKEAVFGQSLRV